MSGARPLPAAVVAAPLLIAGALGVAWQATGSVDDAGRLLADETARLMTRTREIDALEALSSTAGNDERVRARLVEAARTAEDDEEVRSLEGVLSCLSTSGCDVPAALAQVREAQSHALRRQMQQTVSTRRDANTAHAIAALLAAVGAVWSARALAHAARRGPTHAGRDDDATADRDREAHLRARLEELYALRLRAIESDRFSAYGEIAAGLSHGLKTPLASIRAATELALAKVGDTHPAAVQLEDVLVEVDSLIEQVRRFLQAAGPGAPVPTRLSPSSLVQTLTSSYAADAQARGVALRADVPPGLSDVVVDPALLEMALRNLVENALAASPSGSTVTVQAGPSITPERVGIDHSAPTTDRWVSIAVLDEGPGMPDVIAAGGQRPSDKPGGSGIGLAIARRVAARHGGVLDVDKRTPCGTAVHVRLPAAQDEA